MLERPQCLRSSEIGCLPDKVHIWEDALHWGCMQPQSSAKAASIKMKHFFLLLLLILTLIIWKVTDLSLWSHVKPQRNVFEIPIKFSFGGEFFWILAKIAFLVLMKLWLNCGKKKVAFMLMPPWLAYILFLSYINCNAAVSFSLQVSSYFCSFTITSVGSQRLLRWNKNLVKSQNYVATCEWGEVS